MPKLANNKMGYCPECGSEVRLRKAPHIGQKVTCAVCKSKLKVVNRNPVELDWAEGDEFD